MQPFALMDEVAGYPSPWIYIALALGLAVLLMGGRYLKFAMVGFFVVQGYVLGIHLAKIMYVENHYVIPVSVLALASIAYFADRYITHSLSVVISTFLGGVVANAQFGPNFLWLGLLIGLALGLLLVTTLQKASLVIAPTLLGTFLVISTVGSVIVLPEYGLLESGYRAKHVVYVMLSVFLLLLGIVVHSSALED